MDEEPGEAGKLKDLGTLLAQVDFGKPLTKFGVVPYDFEDAEGSQDAGKPVESWYARQPCQLIYIVR